MKQDVVTLILWLVSVYAAICATAYFGNRVFMYFPDPTRVAPVEVGLNGVKEVELTVADDVALIAWHAPAKDDKPTILYFHGNGANAASRAPKIQRIRERGFGVAPLTSTVDVARSVYFWLPLGLLITDKYNNERNIRSVAAPVLILHGEQDGVIPVEMGQRVYGAANQPKRIELFPQATHDDLFDQGAWEKTQAFVDSLFGAR
jgi:hypothetical protein